MSAPRRVAEGGFGSKQNRWQSDRLRPTPEVRWPKFVRREWPVSGYNSRRSAPLAPRGSSTKRTGKVLDPPAGPNRGAMSAGRRIEPALTTRCCLSCIHEADSREVRRKAKSGRLLSPISRILRQASPQEVRRAQLTPVNDRRSPPAHALLQLLCTADPREVVGRLRWRPRHGAWSRQISARLRSAASTIEDDSSYRNLAIDHLWCGSGERVAAGRLRKPRHQHRAVGAGRDARLR